MPDRNWDEANVQIVPDPFWTLELSDFATEALDFVA